MTPEEVQRVLARTDPFELLADEELAELGRRMEVRVYPAGAHVFRQGEVSRGTLFIVLEGLVEITLAGPQGEEAVVGLRRRHDFFGETVALSQERYPGGARVREAARCALLARRDLERLIYGHPDFSGFFNALLAERMRLMYEQMVSEAAAAESGSAPERLFRRRVSEIMSTPVETCPPEARVTEVARRMEARRIGSLVVVDAAGRPLGLVTERHLVSHLIARGRFPVDTCRAGQVMRPEPASVAPEASVGQALSCMTRHGTRHLVVMARGALVGVVTAADLVRARGPGPLVLTPEIEACRRLEDLAALGREADRVLAALVADQAPLAEILEVVAELHERLACRVLELSEAALQAEGLGKPPVPYCWINMGSAARREQTLRTDQDNALIYADPPDGRQEEVARYFEALARRAVEALVACGFAECPGGVMAINPAWRRSAADWNAAVDRWVASQDPDHIRTLTILLDFRPLHGDLELGRALRERIFHAFAGSLNASHLLTRDDHHAGSPVGFLGRINTERGGSRKGRFNLKASALAHLVNGLRIFAVNHRIGEPSSLGRLKDLEAAAVLEAEEAAIFRASFETLMMFKIRSNLAQLHRGAPVDSYIDPAALSPNERMLLKDALAGVARMQKLLNRRFKVFWLNYFG
jgi:CBS domain-containing protein